MNGHGYGSGRKCQAPAGAGVEGGARKRPCHPDRCEVGHATLRGGRSPAASNGCSTSMETRHASVRMVEQLSFLLKRKSPDQIRDALANWLGRIKIERLRSRLRDRRRAAGDECDVGKTRADRNETHCKRGMLHGDSLGWSMISGGRDGEAPPRLQTCPSPRTPRQRRGRRALGRWKRS